MNKKSVETGASPALRRIAMRKHFRKIENHER
jgi:hypothetical protein